MNFEATELEKYCSIVEQTRESLKSISPKSRIPHNHINVLPVIMDYLGENCKNYFEIGTYFGGSMLVSMNFISNCNFYGLDFFGDGPNNEFLIDNTWHLNSNQSAQPGADITLEMVNNTLKTLNSRQFFELIQGDSQNIETIKSINERFFDQIDLLFIDADHSFDATCNDFNNYKNLVRKGGFIVFDDYGFISEVKRAVDHIDKSDFEIIGRPPIVPSNDFKSDLDEQFNASFILKRK